jgi:hypothetical protein
MSCHHIQQEYDPSPCHYCYEESELRAQLAATQRELKLAQESVVKFLAEAQDRDALAAVEKERDAALRQHSVGLEKIREVQAELAHVKVQYGLLKGVGARADAAEKERDEATGALAGAMEVVKVLERTRQPDFATFAVARCSFCWCSAPESGGDDHDADCPVQRVIRSPAADLAARHDAEIERRALERVLSLPRYDEGEYSMGMARHREGDWLKREDVEELCATPTPEKPR